MISKFVTATEIQKMFKEAGTPVSYKHALRIKKELIDMHEDVILPNKNVIPLSWVIEVYGENAYKRKRKKDASL